MIANVYKCKCQKYCDFNGQVMREQNQNKKNFHPHAFACETYLYITEEKFDVVVDVKEKKNDTKKNGEAKIIRNQKMYEKNEVLSC